MKSPNPILSTRIVLVFLVFDLLLASCAPAITATTPVEPAPAQSPTGPGVIQTPQSTSESLPLDTLRNMDYHSVRAQPFPYEFTLTDGIYLVPDGPYANEAHMQLMEPVAYGDLNQDGADDAAVILEGWFGGTGQFIFLAAVIDQDGGPVNAATVLLGDRIVVNASSIQDGNIVLDMITHTPGKDPACCPTLQTTVTYQVAENDLVEVSNP
jgi:hypothetical protein